MDNENKAPSQHDKDQEIKKTYLAFCIGNPGHRGEISEPIAKIMKKGIEKVEVDRQEGVHATTLFDCLFAGDTISMVRLNPITGRTHQLRVHMLAMGHPILGDDFYAHGDALKAARCLQLHAEILEFRHPNDETPQKFRVSCPF